MPLVFVGYGITAKDKGYDDYEKIDVKGKAVIVLRHEPQQENPHSAFDGKENSRHATFATKVSNAFQHGAAAVVFVSDELEVSRRRLAARTRWEHAAEQLAQAHDAWQEKGEQGDEALAAHRKNIDSLARQILQLSEDLGRDPDIVFEPRQAGEDDGGRDMPVVFVRRAIVDQLLAERGTDLAKLEREIDVTPTPRSFELPGWRIGGRVAIERQRSQIKNVVGVLEGTGPLAEETLIIGAHYDHVGYGGEGSADPGKKEIHNGADDNASGSAVLLEVARKLASREKKLPRRVVFIAFTGEERGLLGSAHYAKEPLVPLEKTIAMLNMDMVGRLQDNKLIVYGTGTASEFETWVGEANAARADQAFQLIEKPDGFGPSDHATFYGKKIPVLHFFTGSHADYHRPTDDIEKLDIGGMRRIGDLVTAMAEKIALHPAKPTYREVKAEVVKRDGDRPYFGSVPDFGAEKKGYALAGVTKDSPADRGGLVAGDVIVDVGGNQVANLEDFDSALRKFKASDKVKVVVERGGAKVELDVVLDPPR